MNNILSWLGGAVIAAIVAAAIAFNVHPSTPVSPQQQQEHLAGAAAGPDIPSPYVQWGGVYRWAQASPTLAASSTVCAIQVTATSTLRTASIRIDTAPSYAQTYVIGYSRTMDATTTTITNMSFAANVNGTVNATTSATALTGINVDAVLSPGSWLNFNISTSTTAGVNQATGACSATFDQI